MSTSTDAPASTTAPIGRTLAAVSFATTTAVLTAFLLGSQGVQLRRELDFDIAALGVIVALPWLAASLTSALMGHWCQRIGGGVGLRIAGLTSAAVQLAIAAFAHSWWFLAVAAAVAGLANSLAQPGANLLLTRVVHDSRHGLAFAVKQSALPFALLLGGVAVPALTLTVGWRWTFVGGGILALLGALVVPVRAERAHLAEAPPSPRVPLRGRLGPLVVLAMGVGLGAAAAGGLAGFLTSATVAAGVAEGPAGWLLAAGSAIGITSRLLVGSWADRSARDPFAAVATMMVVGSAFYVVMAAQTVPAYLVAIPFAFGAGWAWPGLFNLGVVRAHADAPGAPTGVTQTGTYLGAGLGPLLFGTIADDGAFGLGWLLAASWLVAGAVAMVVGRRLLDRRRPA